MTKHRFALLDAAGKCVNVVEYQMPWRTDYAIPGVKYLVPLEEVEEPKELGRDWQWLVALSRVGPGDSVDTKTGEVTPLVPPTPPLPTKAELLAYAANKRWEVETGGCPWGEYTIATDRDSQSKLIATIIAIQVGMRANPSGWKMAHGKFVSLTNDEMMTAIMAAHAHIAGAFDTEENVIAGIESDIITTYAQIEVAFQ